MRMKCMSVVAAAVVAIASTGSADMIGDFEGSLDPGWVVTAGAGTISTAWASSGTSSLQIAPAAGFTWALQFNDLAIAQQLGSTHVLQFDVYWDSGEWLPETGGDAWVQWDLASLNSETTGWTQMPDKTTITDPANPSFPGSWDPNSWGANHQRTLTYDFTGLGFDPTGSGWAQFNLGVNFGAAETVGNFYIDNVQTVLIPEPGTLALLGLGGMVIAFRRMRRRDEA